MQSAPLGNLTIRVVIAVCLTMQFGHVGMCQPALSESVGDQALARSARQLNVTIAEFDPGLGAQRQPDPAIEVFAQIRRIESRLLPYLLRQTLEATGEWGAVRVQPEPDPAAELQVTGVIERSDGVALALSIGVTDSRGKQWLQNRYALSPVFTDDENNADDAGDAFQQLYDQIAVDLRIIRDTLDVNDLDRIVTIATLKYARGLAPVAFDDFLQTGDDGMTELRRLPAAGDPMMARVVRIREYEYLFTDAADEKYQAYFDELAQTYTLWRKYRRRIANFRDSETRRLETYGNPAPRGSYQAIKRSYDNYQRAKIQEQNLQKWAAAFDNEAAPTVMQLEGQVVALQGDLRDRYSEWRGLLKALFLLETGGVGDATGQAP